MILKLVRLTTVWTKDIAAIFRSCDNYFYKLDKVKLLPKQHSLIIKEKKGKLI
jgi:hypothetical protein